MINQILLRQLLNLEDCPFAVSIMRLCICFTFSNFSTTLALYNFLHCLWSLILALYKLLNGIGIWCMVFFAVMVLSQFSRCLAYQPEQSTRRQVGSEIWHHRRDMTRRSACCDKASPSQ